MACIIFLLGSAAQTQSCMAPACHVVAAYGNLDTLGLPSHPSAQQPRSLLPAVLGLLVVENSHGQIPSLMALASGSLEPGPPCTGESSQGPEGGPTAHLLVCYAHLCEVHLSEVSLFSFHSQTDFRCVFRNVCWNKPLEILVVICPWTSFSRLSQK